MQQAFCGKLATHPSLTTYVQKCRQADRDENGRFDEISSVNKTIFMQITSTEMGLTCWRIWRFWQFLTSSSLRRSQASVLTGANSGSRPWCPLLSLDKVWGPLTDRGFAIHPGIVWINSVTMSSWRNSETTSRQPSLSPAETRIPADHSYHIMGSKVSSQL